MARELQGARQELASFLVRRYPRATVRIVTASAALPLVCAGAWEAIEGNWIIAPIALVTAALMVWFAQRAIRPGTLTLEAEHLRLVTANQDVRLPFEALALSLSRYPSEGAAYGSLLSLTCGDVRVSLMLPEILPLDAYTERTSDQRYDWVVEDRPAELVALLRERFHQPQLQGPERYLIPLESWETTIGAALRGEEPAVSLALEGSTIGLLRSGKVVALADASDVSLLVLRVPRGEDEYPGLSLQFPGGEHITLAALDMDADIGPEARELDEPSYRVGPAELKLLRDRLMTPK